MIVTGCQPVYGWHPFDMIYSAEVSSSVVVASVFADVSVEIDWSGEAESTGS